VTTPEEVSDSTLRPRDVFLRLVEGVAAERWHELPELYADRTDVRHPFDPLRAPALRTRDELREHFTPPPGGLGIEREATNFTIHETADPEVIVAEFEYRGTVLATGRSFVTPCVFVMRVRDGQIVESRDYIDPLASARARGGLDDLFATLRERESDEPSS
jgi:ketosteroid isomerase-like protein